MMKKLFLLSFHIELDQSVDSRPPVGNDDGGDEDLDEADDLDGDLEGNIQEQMYLDKGRSNSNTGI